MKKLLVFALTASLVGCGAHQKDVDNADPMKYAETITPSDLKERVYIFASDEFEGRETGEPGQKKAAEYLKEQYKNFDIPSALGGDDYFQEVPKSYFRGDTKASENVVAFIKGSEKPEEVLVISSHYDHVGMDKDGNVFNGADDDASGTMGVVEIAQAFSEAVKDGYTPKRSILFLNNTGEEKGLVGSKFYTDNPIFPLEETVANLNIDMIGRIDPDHEGNDNYIYLIGSDKLSTELHELSEEVNSKYMNLDLDYTYNDENDPNRFYYRSDHYNFAKNNVPVIFYFNGVHADYHKITDTPDKINYDALSKRARLVFLTAWEIANRDERLVVDKAE
ncbi:MAG: peptidase M28 [Zunongwangia sp.]|jgi:Zn-dependent M28 family amino/carboxypeptidase|uniref:M28 family metallopeptidase n=1 Tax=Zunongwangia profunda TaxID=398743 RepID=UPI000C895835|nr:M28 family metallopeptidase [Zunongwangia profunda]MAO34685.1 peptidase M28 [Zunongwangia sp.]MCC4228656.1 M28 family metallopeptidase [Zunongwangia profunda]HAJ81228.1 peptidase M28 [Zunongwangia profunda]|tara:strand:- start:93 stop:1097 length:1005 start_codon:yes stop_codon:yes gene_type:complete